MQALVRFAQLEKKLYNKPNIPGQKGLDSAGLLCCLLIPNH